jgi:pimeloyl-ACP methyl ester carboxylesterase
VWPHAVRIELHVESLDDADKIPHGRRRRLQGVLSRGGEYGCAEAASAAWLSDRNRFAAYVFDYGAPTGFRLAARHPDRITAIVSQNGNAYEEGLSDGWTPIRACWEDASQANRKALRAFLTPETTRWQYMHGVPDPTTVSPDGQNLDNYYLARPGADEVQLDLFGDYKSNVALYPSFQQYFRTYKPPLLAVWGKNDPFFLPPGAEAFRRDIPEAEVHFFDTGHFALETHCAEIAKVISDFLGERAGM